MIKLGIKQKLSLLTACIVLTLMIAGLWISSAREIRFKKEEARKLMINLGKQIALVQSLSDPISSSAMNEYLEKTIRSNLSRAGYSITILYLISIDHSQKIQKSVINKNILRIASTNEEKLLQSIISNSQLDLIKIFGTHVQNLKVDLADKGSLMMGFSMQILKNEILEGIHSHLFFGLIIIVLGVLGSIWIAQAITKPLFQLVDGFQKVTRGDFDSTVQIHTHDELESLADSYNQMLSGLKEREMIKDIFRRYASNEVVQNILEGKVKPTLTGELRTVTVLFSDIRMFTALASKLSPEQVVHLLNRYFTAMTDIAIQNEGLIDKFTGDEMMIVFGAPIAHSDDPERAVKTALQMLKELKIVNEGLEREGFPKINIGIGINTGLAVAGNIGSEKRMAYTVIGPEVNLASRLVALAQRGEICLSQNTFERVKDIIQTAPESVMIKGIDKPITIHRFSPSDS